MQTKIEKITGGKTEEIYTVLLENLTFENPHNFIKTAYLKYEKTNPAKHSVNGRIFEYLICETLAQKNITPFYYQVKFERIPNIDFDVVLYNEKQPVILTMKTSLRERWKQANLEGISLKQVYRQSKTYLITLNKSESETMKKRIKNGDIAGLDNCLLANEKEYSDLLESLKKQKFTEAKVMMPIKGRLLAMDKS